LAARSSESRGNDRASRQRRPARALLVACALGLGALVLVLSGWLIAWASKDSDLACGRLRSERAKEICGNFEAGMELEWLGHAIVSPGHRVTFAGVRRTYCELGIGAGDVVTLQELVAAEDWRLQNGGDFLLRLVTGHDRYGTPEAPASIFNPHNPEYILKDGCTP
jgi:hypothetical protein